MSKENLKIKVFRSFGDVDLKSRWEQIMENNKYFIQNSYEWCSTWWKYYKEGKNLNIISVINNQQIEIIAPFYIEKKFIFSIIKFIGSGFTDYHQILVNKNVDYKPALEKLFEYLCSFSEWDYIYLEQINDRDLLFNYINGKLDFRRKFLVRCLIGELNYKSFNDFLKDLKKSDRHKYKRITNRLEEKGVLKLTKIIDSKNFDKNFNVLINMHNKRWANNSGSTKFMVNLNLLFLKDVFKKMFELNKAVLYLLNLDNELISYRLGFIENQQYYDWNTSFNVDFHKYSPGTIINFLIIKDLIDNENFGNIYKFNYMRGDYDYKRRLIPNSDISNNFLFLNYKRNFKGLILNSYYLWLRDLIKRRFKKLIKNKSFRLIFRLDEK